MTSDTPSSSTSCRPAAPFEPGQTPLCPGINLIEASAGTGKTYAIAMLVLRCVVEQGIPLEKLLVVTFTKAATEELTDRIRCRLADARRVLDSDTDNIDNTMAAWLARLAIEPALIRQRLTRALLEIDQAGIVTIHGFCQRVLRELALESGQAFDAELTADLAAIKQACADDFWLETAVAVARNLNRQFAEIAFEVFSTFAITRIAAGIGDGFMLGVT